MKTLIALIAMTTAASAQTLCVPRDVAENAMEHLGEVTTWSGLSSEGAVLEIWQNEETGEWTVTATGPNGRTCLVTDGVAGAVVEVISGPEL